MSSEPETGDDGKAWAGVLWVKRLPAAGIGGLVAIAGAAGVATAAVGHPGLYGEYLGFGFGRVLVPAMVLGALIPARSPWLSFLSGGVMGLVGSGLLCVMVLSSF